MAAVDLGASGGRVIAGRVSGSGVELHEVSRFPNEPVLAGGTLHWDILGLYRSVCSGLSAAAATFPLASAGIDTWGVDYGLLDATGALIGNPVHYRDSRTDGVTVPVPAETLYAVTGIQHLPINTIYQLAAAAGTPALSAAETLLLIPDLLAYWLTGSVGAEVTNASTTGLLDVTTRTWAVGLIEQAGIPAGIFPPLRQPGDLIGPITAGQTRVGSGGGAVPTGRARGRQRGAGAADRGRVARHRVGGGRGAGLGTALRLHLLRHLVAGRPRARRPGPDRGEQAGQLHQRGRPRRHHPLPAQRDRPVATAGVPADLGSLRRIAGPTGADAGGRAEADPGARSSGTARP